MVTLRTEFDSPERRALNSWFTGRLRAGLGELESEVGAGASSGRGRSAVVAGSVGATIKPRQKRAIGRLSAAATGAAGAQAMQATGLGGLSRVAGVAKTGGVIGLAIAAVALVDKVAGGVVRRREDAIKSLEDARGTEFIANMIEGSIDSPGVSGMYIRASHQVRKIRAFAAAAKGGISAILDGEGLERAQQEGRWAFWQARLDAPPSIRRRNNLERVRFDTQIDQGGTFFGGWGKVPEYIGG